MASTASADPGTRSPADDLVSVIMPAHGAEATVAAAIGSALAQEHQALEVLVVDDASRDGTAAEVARMADGDARVRPLSHPTNRGAAAARNTAIAAAKGRYLAFLDADDLWLPGKLSRQLAFQRQTGAPLTFTAYRRIAADGSRTGHLIGVPDRIDHGGLLRNTAIAASTVILDRHLTGPITMRTVFYDDLACWLDVLRGGATARGLPEDLMRYRVRPGSLSSNKLHSASQVWTIYRDLEGLSLGRAAWCLAHYGTRGILKRLRF